MSKSGSIFGAVSFALLLGVTLISPFCVPCLGLFLGLAAGYVAGIFDKPVSSRDSLRIGGLAGLVAGGFGLIGELIGVGINVQTMDVSAYQQIFRSLGITGIVYSQSEMTAYQWIGGICFGIFNILWMAILGIAGAALWYQFVGRNQATTMVPPKEPIPPAL